MGVMDTKSDLISRSHLTKRLTMMGANGAKSHVRAYARCVNEVETAPAVDAAPVVHARLVYSDGYIIPKCSACELDVADSSWAFFPHCGAILDD